jgi:hypothetical protein
MKFAPFLALTLTIIAVSGQVKAATTETCFQGSTEGVIELSPDQVVIKWDINDFTEASKQAGVIRNYKATAKEVSGEALMNNISDVGSVFISISKDQVRFQETDVHGVKNKPADVRRRVECPKDLSPSDLEE